MVESSMRFSSHGRQYVAHTYTVRHNEHLHFWRWGPASRETFLHSDSVSWSKNVVLNVKEMILEGNMCVYSFINSIRWPLRFSSKMIILSIHMSASNNSRWCLTEFLKIIYHSPLLFGHFSNDIYIYFWTIRNWILCTFQCIAIGEGGAKRTP